MKLIVFFSAFFVIGIPVVMMIQTMGSSNARDSFGGENKQGCLGNLLGVFFVLILFAAAAAVLRLLG